MKRGREADGEYDVFTNQGAEMMDYEDSEGDGSDFDDESEGLVDQESDGDEDNQDDEISGEEEQVEDDEEMENAENEERNIAEVEELEKEYMELRHEEHVCFIESTTANNRLQSYTTTFTTAIKLPIETNFKLPAPIPTWPSGTNFASGIIDLGALQVSQITSLNKVWAAYVDGPDDLGATFYEPASVPEGLSLVVIL